MKKYSFLFFLFILFSLEFKAQTSVSGGASFIRPFGIKSLYTGINIGLELDAENTQVFSQTSFGRLSFFPFKSGGAIPGVVQGIDINTNPYTIPVDLIERYSYTTLELGKKYYGGEGYESGFAFYGGSTVVIILNQIKYRVGDYDETKYFSSYNSEKSSILALALGLNAGIKNSFSFGTLFLEVGGNYSLYQIASPNLQQIPDSYSPLLFNINFGYRKNFY